ncbi:MAG: ClpXP protease specificity-enhancing factor SspB [Pseudomonadota bacterium]
MTDYIGYEALTQAAMRGVVREAIRSAQANCQTPGEHHFYITFRTRAPGVQIAETLVEQFPEDMTIVVQHQFWDLEVHDGHFEIILKFSGVPQHLRIPFSAITRFVDPSVNFGLNFEDDRAANSDHSVLSPAAEDKAPLEEFAPTSGDNGNTVVKLDSFRRK